MTIIKATVRTYSHALSSVEAVAAWGAFRQGLEDKGYPLFGPVIRGPKDFRPGDGTVLELQTEWLHHDQWNTTDGKRVFDWLLYSQDDSRHRMGYWLEYESLEEMQALRRKRHRCGYCGKQMDSPDLQFHEGCLGSEYLRETELELTRWLSVADDGPRSNRADLTESEKAYLLPRYYDAQLHAGKAKMLRMHTEAAEFRIHLEARLRREAAGYTWLVANGISGNNMLYYNHSGVFTFGAFKPVSPALAQRLVDELAGFPVDYDIMVEGHPKISKRS